MATYIILNVIFILFVCSALYAKKSLHWNKYMALTLAILLLTTAIFDSIMIGIQLFGYNAQHILGIKIGNAPIEDFMYAVLAVVMIPNIWHLLEGKKQDASETTF